jgi:hypothetical protein
MPDFFDPRRVQYGDYELSCISCSSLGFVQFDKARGGFRRCPTCKGKGSMIFNIQYDIGEGDVRG